MFKDYKLYAIEVSLSNFNTICVHLSSLALLELTANKEEFDASIAFNKPMGRDSSDEPATVKVATA